jgi:hypothetical protein
MRRSFALSALLSLGCVACFPVHRTIRPNASLTVLDDTRRPIAGARVILITSRYPYGRVFLRDTVMSDSVGVARFTSRKDWEAEVLMIHGAWVYFWHWCVETPGRSTYDSRRIGGFRFKNVKEVTMPAGDAAGCLRDK